MIEPLRRLSGCWGGVWGVPAQQNTSAGEASEGASSALLGLADCSQAEMLHFLQSVSVGAGKSPGSPNGCAQMDFDRAGSRCTKAGRRSRSSSSRSSASTSPKRGKSCARSAHPTCQQSDSRPKGGRTRPCSTFPEQRNDPHSPHRRLLSSHSLIRLLRFGENGLILAPELTDSCLRRMAIRETPRVQGYLAHKKTHPP